MSKPYSRKADLISAAILKPAREALRRYIAGVNPSAVLIEHDTQARENRRLYYGADLEIIGIEHPIFVEDEAKDYWNGIENFPSNGADVSTRPLKTSQAALFIQASFDGRKLWVAPMSVVKASRIIQKECFNFCDADEGFYRVSESNADVYLVEWWKSEPSLMPIGEHGYLEQAVAVQVS
jgi:hypothetical protein